MEQVDMRASMFVAPLQIKKTLHDGPPKIPTLDFTEDSAKVSLELARQLDIFGSSGPDDAPEDSQFEDITDQPIPTFHNYLRAFYPFQPSTLLSPSTVTLPLNAGDIVLVHSIHTNGWADGTLLENGSRGWLPTNYCEPYEHVPMRPLLKALTEFWDAIRAGSESSWEVFQNQDYMRGLISGVRLLLERSECLTRDSELVKRNENIRKCRKALLFELSVLVKITKRMQDVAAGSASDESPEEIFDEMLLRAFKVVAMAVKFLDIWNEEVGINRDTGNAHAILGDPVPMKNNYPAVPPFGYGASSASTMVELTAESDLAIEPRTSSLPLLGEPYSQPLNNGPRSRQRSLRASKNEAGTALPNRPPSLLTKRASLSHRMSYTSQTGHSRAPNLASAKLDYCYDTFLGVLGSFLGLHMQSRSSSELLLTTQQSVKSCRDLLAVIQMVLDHDFRRSDMLLEAKDNMCDNITDLVEAAREAFSPANSGHEDLIFLPDQGRRLVNAAMACVRGAGDCVAKTTLVLEQIGDFELESSEIHSLIITPNSSKSPEPAEDTEFPEAQTSNAKAATMANSVPMPTRPAPRLSISTEEHVTVEQSSTMILTPTSATTGPTSPSSTSTAPILTPPTPFSVHDDHEPMASSSLPGSSGGEPLRPQKSVARNVVNSTGSDSTFLSSARNSRASVGSRTSTRATSPDPSSQYLEPQTATDRFSGSVTTLAYDCEDTEEKMLERTFAHELLHNKEGQVIGGTLPALIEKLTAHDSTPDALFVSTFYLTFRLFTTPKQFAEALVSRFVYVEETINVAAPVRLRVYNVFKGWLESHWRHDCDNAIQPFILDFARNMVSPTLPTAGKRLIELAEKVGSVQGHVVPRLLSSIGKTNTSISQYVSPDSAIPSPIITRNQLAALRTWKSGGGGVSILDFDPLELARQITIKESTIFCSILPEELLATEWMKQSGSLAVNVRAMSTLSTDITNLVVDSILQLEEPKKRATLIKHWVKIANKCLELNNYDTLMAIICSLDLSTITRLKKTWEIVSHKTKSILEELKKIVDVSLNFATLRNRLQNQVPPCLPFVGIYLTDLTFVDEGNPSTRKLDTGSGPINAINFDKHVKTAKIISDLQRFQIPYRLTEVPELQTWMQDQLIRVRSAGEKTYQNHYRRSLLLEPREQTSHRASTVHNLHGWKGGDKERFDFLPWANSAKDKPISTTG